MGAVISYELSSVQIVCVIIAIVALIAYIVRDGIARLDGGKNVQRHGGVSNVAHYNAAASFEEWLLGYG